jgi:hypothetical protein
MKVVPCLEGFGRSIVHAEKLTQSRLGDLDPDCVPVEDDPSDQSGYDLPTSTGRRVLEILSQRRRPLERLVDEVCLAGLSAEEVQQIPRFAQEAGESINDQLLDLPGRDALTLDARLGFR